MTAVPTAFSKLLKHTSSLCPYCKQQISAQVYEADGKVYLRKTCPDHGQFDVLINSDKRFYYSAKGSSSSCDCGSGCHGPVSDTAVVSSATSVDHSGHDPTLIGKIPTCIALIELVQSCNLRCPTCFADSPHTEPDEIQSLSTDEFWQRINNVLRRKNNIDVLQLSGGEPTIHPEFCKILEDVLARADIGYTLINTNGLRLAQDEAFMERLGQLHQRHRKFEVYLQFDGPQEAGQAALRGGDFRALRLRAIDRCAHFGIPISLAMTVTPDNLSYLGDSLRFGLSRPAVRGLTLQPMFTSGRTPRIPSPFVQLGVELSPAAHPLNVADMILHLIDQSDSLLSAADFTPLPCGNPNCHTIGYIIRRDKECIPVSRRIDFSNVQGFLKDRIDFRLEDLQECGCESEPLGHLLKELEIGPDNVFRIFIKPFMDAWTYDQDRIDRCCVHVVTEDGNLESFCRHYAMRS